jgi:hypothetical protein
VQRDGVLIFAPTGCTHLPYPEAALWDLVISGRKLEDCTRLWAIVTCTPEDAASALVGHILDGWQAAGWVVHD